jgi:hypothetical protein
MIVTWKRDYCELEAAGVIFFASCFVRNEIDAQYIRRKHDPREVVYTITADGKKGSPYMPRKFPKGDCDIIAIERNGQKGIKFNTKEFGLVRIRTNASQMVEVWALDSTGGYDHPTGKFVDDHGYLLHYSEYLNTLGCGRIGKNNGNQIEKLALLLEPDLAAHGRIPLKVV